MSAEQKTIGRYRIIGELGRGAMGVVYHAEDPVLDRAVALKTIFIPADDQDRREYEARFTQEARAAGRLSHPGIVTIYDVGREGDMVYMTMELLEGTDLSTRASGQRFGVREALQIALQVAEALAFAHERGVVHRDIKPPNIMLLAGGRVKIMDFGIARMRTSDLKTQTGLMLGTPRYMSPEQVAGRPLDHRSDIFSLGTVLYELLTGTKLFAGDDATEIMYNVSHLRPVPPSRINRQVPPVLDLVVAKALDKNPEERYQDAAQFAADLRACLSEITGTRAPDATTRTERIESSAEEPTRTLRMNEGAGAEPSPRAGSARAPITVDGNTRLTVSRVLDSSLALERLANPSPKDHARLARAPRPRSIFTLLWRDAGFALLALAVAAALAAAAAYILV